VQTNLPGKVFETVIPRNVRLSEAPSHGKPVMLYDIESKGSQSYLALAAEMIARHQAELEAPGAHGQGAPSAHAGHNGPKSRER